MLWLKRLEKAMDYIEEHLEEEISLEELGKITCCSPFHFQRIFSCLTELSLAQYIRKRRMTKAAADLQAGEKVLDVALKYGYDSPTSFFRHSWYLAFRRQGQRRAAQRLSAHPLPNSNQRRYGDELPHRRKRKFSHYWKKSFPAQRDGCLHAGNSPALGKTRH